MILATKRLSYYWGALCTLIQPLLSLRRGMTIPSMYPSVHLIVLLTVATRSFQTTCKAIFEKRRNAFK